MNKILNGLISKFFPGVDLRPKKYTVCKHTIFLKSCGTQKT